MISLSAIISNDSRAFLNAKNSPWYHFFLLVTKTNKSLVNRFDDTTINCMRLVAAVGVR